MAYGIEWFFNNTATFQSSSGEIGNDGLFRKNAISEITVACDIQPISRDDIIDDSSHLSEAKYKIYCNANPEIKRAKAVIVNDEEFSLLQVVDWDYYYICYIKAVQ